MIIGIGTDIIEIKRIKKLYKKSGDRFLKKILTEKEAEKTKKIKNKKKFYGYLAKRFAAKEAISKALGTGIGDSISFKEIEILNKKSGAPVAAISGKKSGYKIHISLSDDEKNAIAFAVIEE